MGLKEQGCPPGYCLCGGRRFGRLLVRGARGVVEADGVVESGCCERDAIRREGDALHIVGVVSQRDHLAQGVFVPQLHSVIFAAGDLPQIPCYDPVAMQPRCTSVTALLYPLGNPNRRCGWQRQECIRIANQEVVLARKSVGLHFGVGYSGVQVFGRTPIRPNGFARQEIVSNIDSDCRVVLNSA